MLVLTILIEVGAGVMLILGYRARMAAIVLAVRVAIVTPIFHGYRAVDAAQYGNPFNHLRKNTSIIRGLLRCGRLAPARTASMVATARRLAPGTVITHGVGTSSQ